MALRRASKGSIALAMALAFMAGAVDAIGFSELGGTFVSFMSGNSTRLSIFLAGENGGRAAEVAGVILAFVLGAGCGSIIGRTLTDRRQTVVLTCEAILLGIAAMTGQSGLKMLSALCMASAMGLENSVFTSPQGETTVNLTFMTGALVKIGERVAVALLGGPRWSWVPYLLLWLSLVMGALTGALCYAPFGVVSLYGVSGLLLTLAVGFAIWPKPGRMKVDAST